MTRRGGCSIACLCAGLVALAGCGSDGDPSVDRDGADASGARDSSAAPGGDASVSGDDAGGISIDVDAGGASDAGGPPPGEDAGSTEPPPPGGVDPHFEVEMTWVTANIGRDYATRAQVAGVIDGVGDVVGGRMGPRFVGWQEIGESDPCGNCEIEEIRRRFGADAGWETLRPEGRRPDDGTELVKVPVTSRGAGGATSERAVFASPGWAGVSPTRFVTVAYYAERNLSLVNTHFIARAWSCGSEVARRRDYWRRAWSTLQDEVAREHDRGRNVVVTGDLNRPRAADDCNPAWDPASLHPRARVVGGAGIDYVYAVPAMGWGFTGADTGSIRLGIDGHEARWVSGHFEAR